MRIMGLTLLLALLVIASPAPAVADCQTNWMDCTADSPVELGSFTLRATEVIGAITAKRDTAAKRLKRHEISVDQALAVQANADRARALWQQALDACRADVNGNCANRSDERQALALLTAAKKALQ